MLFFTIYGIVTIHFFSICSLQPPVAASFVEPGYNKYELIESNSDGSHICMISDMSIVK